MRTSAVKTHALEILNMGRAGMRYSHIANRVHTNERHIRKFLHDHGIVLAPCSFRGNNNPNWKGGRILDKTGYVLIYMPNNPRCNHLGYVREHRYVMECHLGRPLSDSEVVHHKNGDREDNRVCNLVLFERNGLHLREELVGKVPRWSQEGIARMKEGIARSAKKRRPNTRIRSGRDVRQW